MIALSDSQSYEGGGSYFPNLNTINPTNGSTTDNKSIHLNQGEMLTFASNNYHQGIPITKGQRYLLVGFCYTSLNSKNSINIPGNINLKFKMIKNKK
jgi:predicted 2-oxoglutarate/Fe(II)-dependent dioxygenase YbiX